MWKVIVNKNNIIMAILNVIFYYTVKELRGFSLQENYTDRATAAYRQS
jgi:hypothetical protein